MRLVTNIDRRTCLKGLARAVTALFLSSNASKLLASQTEELNVPDPGATAELLVFNPEVVEAPLRIRSRGPKKDANALSEKMLALGHEYANRHVSRQTNPRQVGQFLNLFGLDLRYSNGQFVPFCAAGVSFVACRAYCELFPEISYDADNPVSELRGVLTDINHYYFKPSPAVRQIKSAAENRGTWIKSSIQPKPGWLVVFSWNRDGVPNHIGLVDSLTSDGLKTIEFNTSSGLAGDQSNGGAVALRQRKLRYVLGFIKTS
jgi:hypothetical protein